MSVFETVKQVIMEIKDISGDKITMEARFVEDLDADSLDVVEMLMLLEEKYEFSVPEENLDEMKTVKDIVEFFEARLNQKA